MNYSRLPNMVDEIELLCMARRNELSRVRDGELKRPEQWVQRRRTSLEAFEDVLKLLRDLRTREAT